jgi:hypothetical protein
MKFEHTGINSRSKASLGKLTEPHGPFHLVVAVAPSAWGGPALD